MRRGKVRDPNARCCDREILYLALPALGALAAEPGYMPVDTDIGGHPGTPQLAALAIAATLLSTCLTLLNLLTYGTTAQVAWPHGAGEDAAAGRLGCHYHGPRLSILAKHSRSTVGTGLYSHGNERRITERYF